MISIFRRIGQSNLLKSEDHTSALSRFQRRSKFYYICLKKTAKGFQTKFADNIKSHWLVITTITTCFVITIDCVITTDCDYNMMCYILPLVLFFLPADFEIYNIIHIYTSTQGVKRNTRLLQSLKRYLKLTSEVFIKV